MENPGQWMAALWKKAGGTLMEHGCMMYGRDGTGGKWMEDV